jgi:hypothetical protein
MYTYASLCLYICGAPYPSLSTHQRRSVAARAMGNAHSGDGEPPPAGGWSVAEPPSDVFVLVLAALQRDWAARASVASTCRGWARLSAQDATWKAMCGALASAVNARGCS